jgi:hypothetical protein
MQKFPYMHQLNISDRSLINTVKTSIVDMVTNRTNVVSASSGFKRPDAMEIILLLLPLLALFLWSISLQTISLNDMNELGLISVLSPRIIVALGILVMSFALTLQRHEVRVSLLVFQLICIMLVMYATPNLIEGMPRFTPVYRNSGYTDFIIQTGTVDPWVDFYFNFPGFFVLSAFFTKVFGYSTILSYAGWASVFFNLIYVGPMYTIFTSITTNKRLVWLSLLFFNLTNWVWQDYFCPQGLNFFLYLVIIMILLRWFSKSPKEQVQLGKDASLAQKFFVWLKAPGLQSPSIEPWQRRGLLCCLILIFGLVVFSHPLTPIVILLSVLILVAFRRCYPFWLPILMLAMTAYWDFVIGGPFLAQHYNFIISLGNLTGNVPKSITSGKMQGDQLYQVIAKTRLYMTVLLWLLAFLGSIKRLRQGNRDITPILLAISAFPLIAAQSYGGEMLMRIYLFTAPFMCFFAASLFFNNSVVMAPKLARTHATFPWRTATVMAPKPARTRATFPWRTAAIIAASLILLGSFFFTRYGDERVDYISHDEWNAVQYLYQIAPANALILEAWNDAPMFFKDYTKYDVNSLAYLFPTAVINANTDTIIEHLEYKNNHNSYIVFSQEEQALATTYNGLPRDTLQRLETGLLQTKKFKLIYHNSDAQILQFVGDLRGGT